MNRTVDNVLSAQDAGIFNSLYGAETEELPHKGALLVLFLRRVRRNAFQNTRPGDK